MTSSEAPPRVVAIGDSLIYGRLDGRSGGWVGHLRSWLEQEGPEMSAVFNLGIGGETAPAVLRRIHVELPIRQPNIVIIGAGTNDCRRPAIDAPREVEIDEYERTLDAAIQFAKSSQASVAVAAPIPVDEAKTRPHHGEFFYSNSDVEEYVTRAHEVSGRHGAVLIPFYEGFSTSQALTLDRPELLKDGIHPNPDGHLEMFLIAQRALRPILTSWQFSG